MDILDQNNEKVRKLQLAELEILKEVRDFCDKKSITYYLGFGTLLGAVRHQGFIPWDDDIDIFMKRQDYERFLAAAAELPDQLTVRTYHNSRLGKENIALQAKVERKNQYIIRNTNGKDFKQRIWIDIFTVDGMPKTRLARDLHWMNIQYRYVLCRIARSGVGHKAGPRPFIEKAAIYLTELTNVRRFLPLEETFSRLEHTVSKYPVEKNPLVITFAHAYGKNTIVPGNCFGTGRKILFEGELFNIPDDPDTLLKCWYGEYMQLPPPEKRVAKHCVEIITE